MKKFLTARLRIVFLALIMLSGLLLIFILADKKAALQAGQADPNLKIIVNK
jgi:hypothetical protein